MPIALAADNPFNDAAELDRLRVVLLRITRRIRATSPDDITASQLSTLGTVLRHGPIGISEIAEREHVQPPTASKIVARLEQRGSVERRTNPSDRRSQQIAITARGRALADEVRVAGRGWLAEQIATLENNDIASIAAALPALERLLGHYDAGNPETAPLGERAERQESRPKA